MANWDELNKQLALMSQNSRGLQDMAIAKQRAAIDRMNAGLSSLNTMVGIAGTGANIWNDIQSRKDAQKRFDRELEFRREQADLDRELKLGEDQRRADAADRSYNRSLGISDAETDKLQGLSFDESSANTYDDTYTDDYKALADMIRKYQDNPSVISAEMAPGRKVAFDEAASSGNIDEAMNIFIESTAVNDSEKQDFGDEYDSYMADQIPRRGLLSVMEEELKGREDYRDSIPEEFREGAQIGINDLAEGMRKLSQDMRSGKAPDMNEMYKPSGDDLTGMREMQDYVSSRGEYEDMEAPDISQKRSTIARQNWAQAGYPDNFTDSVTGISFSNYQGDGDSDDPWANYADQWSQEFFISREGLLDENQRFYSADPNTSSVMFDREKAEKWIKDQIKKDRNIPDMSASGFNKNNVDMSVLSTDQVKGLVNHYRGLHENFSDDAIVSAVNAQFQNEEQKENVITNMQRIRSTMYPTLDDPSSLILSLKPATEKSTGDTRRGTISVDEAGGKLVDGIVIPKNDVTLPIDPELSENMKKIFEVLTSKREYNNASKEGQEFLLEKYSENKDLGVSDSRAWQAALRAFQNSPLFK